MSLKHLKLDPTIENPEFLFKRKKTQFEQRRAAATTYEELVDLGYDEGMKFPEAWAEYVLQARDGE
jgi:hypothetical protein